MGVVTLGLIVANGIFSYVGFNDHSFFEKYLFRVGKVIYDKQYYRLFTSGFLHADWMHLMFNMISFFSFGASLEEYLGAADTLIIYFTSLIGGDILALIFHRSQYNYSAVGASGAVCGVIFAAIALFPGITIDLFFLREVPGWIFGIGYALYTIYGIRSNAGNIGHEAHLGGAMIGLVTAIILVPQALDYNLNTILLIATPSVVFFLILIVKPEILQGK